MLRGVGITRWNRAGRRCLSPGRRSERRQCRGRSGRWSAPSRSDRLPRCLPRASSGPGDGLQIAGFDKLLEGLRGFPLVHGVGVDGVAHDVQVFLEHGLARGSNPSPKNGGETSGQARQTDRRGRRSGAAEESCIQERCGIPGVNLLCGFGGGEGVRVAGDETADADWRVLQIADLYRRFEFRGGLLRLSGWWIGDRGSGPRCNRGRP